MREIKFRGKEIDNGEWVYGDLIENQGRFFIYHATSETTLIDHNDLDITIIATAVDNNTVGQFTGLHDCNGKEIYEGDIILQRGYGRIKPMIVRFEQGAFIVGWHNGSSTATRPMLIQKRGEIIGNIHDNPELLKGGEE